MSSNRRRTYLLSLLSMGEVLYCGEVTFNSSSWRTTYFNREYDLDKEQVIIYFSGSVGATTSSKTEVSFITNLDSSMSTQNVYSPYRSSSSSSENISITVSRSKQDGYSTIHTSGITYQSSGIDSNSTMRILAIAIPRTDV